MGSTGAVKPIESSSVTVRATSNEPSREKELREAISAKSSDAIRDWLFNNMNEGDKIYILEDDGKYYAYSVTGKWVAKGTPAMEFTAKLSSALAPETGGLYKTTYMHSILRSGKKYHF